MILKHASTDPILRVSYIFVAISLKTSMMASEADDRGFGRHPFRRSTGPQLQAPSDQPAHARSTTHARGLYGHVSDSSSQSERTGTTAATDMLKEHKDAGSGPPRLELGHLPRGEFLHHTHNVEDGMAAPAAVHDACGNYDEKGETGDMQKGMRRADTQDSLANVRTISRVPGNDTYYEKGGLR